jgi:hypothetical protein
VSAVVNQQQAEKLRALLGEAGLARPSRPEEAA